MEHLRSDLGGVLGRQGVEQRRTVRRTGSRAQGLLGQMLRTLCCLLMMVLPACQSGRGSNGVGTSKPKATRSRLAQGRVVAIQRVVCLYDQRPWLNLDSVGDRDPEGIWFRVYLDPGTGKGVHAEGTFHIEMYLIDRRSEETPNRILVSDWHYPSADMARIARPGMLGDGYVLQLRWADKSTAGHEVELVIRFEDALGNVVNSGTKRLRVPKYES